MIDRLLQNNVYVRIGVSDRPCSKGGIFEIYESNDNVTANARAERINDVLKYENFLFIATEGRDLNSPILQKESRNAAEFDNNNYLIREKNTLRVANCEEEILIAKQKASDSMANLCLDRKSFSDATATPDDSAITVIDLADIMENSYGRMVMAYQRARNRYYKLFYMYNQIFEFYLNNRKLKISGYTGNSKRYDKFYYVTLKDEYKQKLLLKKIFEILQVYNSCDWNLLGKDDNINGSIPLLVELSVGGWTSVHFLLSQWLVDKNELKSKPWLANLPMNQLLVSVCTRSKENEELEFSARPYWKLIENFDSCPKLAQHMIDCLEATIENQPKNLTDGKLPKFKIVEFLALTQTVESNHSKRSYQLSRTLGMNKLARQLLRKIAQRKSTFMDTFHQDSPWSSKYPPVGTGGTGYARQVVSEADSFQGAKCYDMSDDSDDENE